MGCSLRFLSDMVVVVCLLGLGLDRSEVRVFSSRFQVSLEPHVIIIYIPYFTCGSILVLFSLCVPHKNSELQSLILKNIFSSLCTHACRASDFGCVVSRICSCAYNVRYT